MRKQITIGLAVAMTATMAFGLKIETAGSGNWASTSIWNGAVVPGTGDTARVNHTLVLDSDESDVLGIVLGRGDSGSLTIQNGGSITAIGSGVGVQVATRNDSSLTLNGGQLTLAAGDLLVGNTNNDIDYQGTVNLLGGTLEIMNGGIVFNTATDILGIENDAQLILGGDQWTAIDGFVAAGNIDWDNGTGIAGVGDKTWDNGSGSYLHTEFDGTDTTVWVNGTIPEPATLGLVMITGAALLGIRRRFMF